MPPLVLVQLSGAPFRPKRGDVTIALTKPELAEFIEDLQRLLTSSEPFEHDHYFAWEGDLSKETGRMPGVAADHLKIIVVPDD